MLKQMQIAWEREKMQIQMQADIQKHQATLIAAQMRNGNG